MLEGSRITSIIDQKRMKESIFTHSPGGDNAAQVKIQTDYTTTFYTQEAFEAAYPRTHPTHAGKTFYVLPAGLTDNPILFYLNEGMPMDGFYTGQDQYCDNPYCDCRDGVLLVYNEQNEKAAIILGWEDEDFYVNIAGYSPGKACRMHEGYLDPDVNQPSYAPVFLMCLRRMLIDNPTLLSYMKAKYKDMKQKAKRTAVPTWLMGGRRERRKANRTKTRW